MDQVNNMAKNQNEQFGKLWELFFVFLWRRSFTPPLLIWYKWQLWLGLELTKVSFWWKVGLSLDRPFSVSAILDSQSGSHWLRWSSYTCNLSRCLNHAERNHPKVQKKVQWKLTKGLDVKGGFPGRVCEMYWCVRDSVWRRGVTTGQPASTEAVEGRGRKGWWVGGWKGWWGHFVKKYLRAGTYVGRADIGKDGIAGKWRPIEKGVLLCGHWLALRCYTFF